MTGAGALGDGGGVSSQALASLHAQVRSCMSQPTLGNPKTQPAHGTGCTVHPVKGHMPLKTRVTGSTQATRDLRPAHTWAAHATSAGLQEAFTPITLQQY